MTRHSLGSTAHAMLLLTYLDTPLCKSCWVVVCPKACAWEAPLQS